MLIKIFQQASRALVKRQVRKYTENILPNQTEAADGNLPEQHVMQSEKPSEGQLWTQDPRSAPSSPPVHKDSSEHLSLHSSTQTANADAPVGQSLMHASREPPGQPLGDGDGDGDGVGVGVGTGAGAGAGASMCHLSRSHRIHHHE